MKGFFAIIILCFVSLSFETSAYGKQFNSDLKNYNVKLQIFDKSQKISEFLVAVARDNAAREYGLMNLGNLDQKYGMLFLFDDAKVVNMWMKNTLIPLDMIFIDEKNNIVNIKEGAIPMSLDIISSQKVVKKVLEINGGLSKKLGIKNGQRIFY